MQLLGSIICVTSLSVVLRFTCTLESLLCGSFMIPTVRPFCKMGTSIKRREKVWISGEFTENKRCDMMFMLGRLWAALLYRRTDFIIFNGGRNIMEKNQLRPALAAFLLMMTMSLLSTALSFFVSPMCADLGFVMAGSGIGHAHAAGEGSSKQEALRSPKFFLAAFRGNKEETDLHLQVRLFMRRNRPAGSRGRRICGSSPSFGPPAGRSGPYPPGCP